jgi:iron complex outermembrane receptor protein
MTEQVEVFGTYGYNHSRFKAGIYDGNKFRLSPDNRASVGLIWTQPVDGGSPSRSSRPTPGSRRCSSTTTTTVTTCRPATSSPTPSWTRSRTPTACSTCASATSPTGANWTVEVFADNLTDEKFIKDAGNTGDGLGMPTFIAGEPRTYGVTVSLRY